MRQRPRASALTLIALLALGLAICTNGEFDSETFDRKLVALFKIIDYVHHRPHQMNADAALGITIAEANIAATLRHENARHFGQTYSVVLGQMLLLCDLTRRYLVEKIVPQDESVSLLHETLNYPELWIRSVSWRKGDLGEIPGPSSRLSYRRIANSIMQGTPKEQESDRCLADIVRESLQGECRISDACIELLTKEDHSRGYPLTHRLLIVQVAKALGCRQTKAGPRFPELIAAYCSTILRDLIDVEAAGFPYNTRDLMMEEVLLCGMEGFLEFTSKHYEDLILSWPHFSGCFSSFGSRSKRANLVRRTSLPTDFGCDSHATALAAAAISLYIRENVENAHQ